MPCQVIDPKTGLRLLFLDARDTATAQDSKAQACERERRLWGDLATSRVALTSSEMTRQREALCMLLKDKRIAAITPLYTHGFENFHTCHPEPPGLEGQFVSREIIVALPLVVADNTGLDRIALATGIRLVPRQLKAEAPKGDCPGCLRARMEDSLATTLSAEHRMAPSVECVLL